MKIKPRVMRRAIGGLTLVLLPILCWTGIDVFRYHVAPRTAAKGVLRAIALKGISGAVRVYDPSSPKRANLGPLGDVDISGTEPIEAVLRPLTITAGPDFTLRLENVKNARIVRSPKEFGYQPFEDPRLQTLRTKYHLDDVMRSSTSELDSLTRLRHWARTRFKRDEYQPTMANFDALEVLDRNLHKSGVALRPEQEYDPCHFFPLLYTQLLVATGHQARLLSITHGLTEVWSNQFEKWILMDAELDHHLERNGIPLSMWELSQLSAAKRYDDVVLVRSPREAGEENPTVPHLHVESLTPSRVVHWFDTQLEITEMRNDWMSNRYFPGHPARSDANSLLLITPNHPQVDYSRRLRPTTERPEDLYWTLNQTTIRMRPQLGRVLKLTLETFTPNFDHFEIVVDGQSSQSQTPALDWPLHQGTNVVSVRSVNKFGVRGIESTAAITLNPEPLLVTGDRHQREVRSF